MFEMKAFSKTLKTSAILVAFSIGGFSLAHSAGFLDRLEIDDGKLKIVDASKELPSLSGSFLAALSAGANGDDVEAVANYKRAVELDPENNNLKQSLFMAMTANGEIAEAIELLKNIPVEEQTQNVNHVVVAADALKKESWKRAITSIDKIDGADLDNLVAKLIGSWALFGDHKIDEAVERANSVKGPDWVNMIKEYHIGLLEAANGKDAEAIAHFEKAVAQRAVAGALTETYMRAVEALARAQYKIGDVDVAKKTINDGLAILPNYAPIKQLKAQVEAGEKLGPLVTTAQQGGAEIFFNVGSAISRQGGLPFAQGHLQLAKYLSPDNAAILVALADVYKSQKKYIKANDIYSQISPKSGYFRRAQLEIGLNYSKLDQAPLAEETLAKLVKEDPDDIVTILSLGAIFGQHEQYGKAVKLYNAALDRIGEPKPKNWLLFYRRGIANERTQNWDQAELDFKKALELSPDQPDVLNYLGYSWIDKGINLDEGLDMIKKAVELKPNSGFIIDSLGWAYYRLGRYEEAVSELQRAVELMPSDPVVNDHLGDAYWKTGRKLEAVFQWKQVLSDNPTDEDKFKITRKLQIGLTN